jgi:hypothetical protein
MQIAIVARPQFVARRVRRSPERFVANARATRMLVSHTVGVAGAGQRTAAKAGYRVAKK